MSRAPRIVAVTRPVRRFVAVEVRVEFVPAQGEDRPWHEVLERLRARRGAVAMGVRA